MDLVVKRDIKIGEERSKYVSKFRCIECGNIQGSGKDRCFECGAEVEEHIEGSEATPEDQPEGDEVVQPVRLPYGEGRRRLCGM